MEKYILENLNKISILLINTNDQNELAKGIMDLLPALIPHEKSFFTMSSIGSRKGRTHIISNSISKEELDAYVDIFEDNDYTTWYLNQESVHVYRDSQIISPQLMEQTRIYREWIAPMGMHYLCGNVLRSGQYRYGELTLLRSEELGDYQDIELYLLSLVTAQMTAWFDLHYQELYKSVGKSHVRELSSFGLTEREEDVVNMLKAGLSTREISESLSIAYSTTRRHISNIYAKLGVSSRVQLLKKVM